MGLEFSGKAESRVREKFSGEQTGVKRSLENFISARNLAIKSVFKSSVLRENIELNNMGNLMNRHRLAAGNTWFLIVLLLSSWVVPGLRGGEITKIGTTSANFLQMEVGARAVALGGAFVGLADDASALYWNPAGIRVLDGIRTHYQITNLYAGVKHHFGGVIYPLTRAYSLGLVANYVDVGDMEVTTLEKPEGTGESFTASSMALGVTFASALTDRVYVGVTAKYIQEKIWMESGSGVAVDIGTVYNIADIGLRIGMALTNLGPDMGIDDGPHLHFYKENPDDYPGSPRPDSKLATRQFPLPLTFSLGVSANVMGPHAVLFTQPVSRLTFCVAANDGFDAPFRTNWGLEYSWRESFDLRAGYHQGYDTAGLALGFGLNLYRFAGLNLQLDFGWSDYGDLGGITLWSLEFQL